MFRHFHRSAERLDVLSRAIPAQIWDTKEKIHQGG